MDYKVKFKERELNTSFDGQGLTFLIDISLPKEQQQNSIQNVLNYSFASNVQDAVKRLILILNNESLVSSELGSYYFDKEASEWVFEIPLFRDPPQYRLPEKEALQFFYDYFSLFTQIENRRLELGLTPLLEKLKGKIESLDGENHKGNS